MSTAKPESFVRGKMLDEKAPPLTNVGIIGWMRQNLFSDVLSTVLTLMALYLIYSLLSSIVPWIFGGIWNANSLSQCRADLLEKYGTSVNRACWAVIHERFWQIMYGFYPNNLYWRPNLTFILLFASIAPVLFNKVPRQMLYISMAFPFVGPWLLWGGTIWTPVMAFMGFVVGMLVNRYVGRASSALLGLIAGVLAAIIWWLFLGGIVGDAFASVAPLVRVCASWVSRCAAASWPAASSKSSSSAFSVVATVFMGVRSPTHSWHGSRLRRSPSRA